MKRLDPTLDLDRFFETLTRAPARVLMLDYDGTLAPFVEDRHRAVPYPGLRERISALMESGHTRVVVVSGRAVDDLRPLLGIEPAPEIWGTHGWERYRAERGIELAEPGERARQGLDQGRTVAEEIAPAGSVEVKPVSVAVHVRGRSPREARALLGTLEERWGPVAEEVGLELHAFDGGLELRVTGRHKGTAVDGILEEAPAGTVAAYLGDDLTDEDAFRALLRHGGLPVLVRKELRKETDAALWLEPPGELVGFLSRWNEAAGSE